MKTSTRDASVSSTESPMPSTPSIIAMGDLHVHVDSPTLLRSDFLSAVHSEEVKIDEDASD